MAVFLSMAVAVTTRTSILLCELNKQPANKCVGVAVSSVRLGSLITYFTQLKRTV